MPIQYRCRCGQEVVLRTREGVYWVVVTLLALTLLNSVVTTLLWYRLRDGAPASQESGPGIDPVPAGTADRAESPGPETVEATDPPGREAPVTTAVTDTEAKDPDPSPDAGTPGDREGPGDEEIATVDPVPPPNTEVVTPVTYRFERPAGLDGLNLALGLAHLSRGQALEPLERVMLLVACGRWGAGALRTQALEIESRQEDPIRGLVALLRNRPGTGSIEIESTAGEGDALEDLRELWTPRWDAWLGGLWTRSLGTEARSWVDGVQKSLPGPADHVILVDLTDSMPWEIDSTIDALRTLVPITLGAGGERRWGWVGFRDEVVDRFELTDDGDAFLASLARWKCEAGGDVPEGVDRAISEALRYESFQWGDGARRHLLVLGDAPPRYEDIRGMISLVEAASRTPEGYRVSCLGILREADFDEVPSFRDLAQAGGGRALFVPERTPLIEPWWELITGPGAPWKRRPF